MCEVFAPPKLIDRADCVLVIIDAQEKLLPAMAGREQLMDNLVRLARFAGIVGLPIVATEQEKLGSLVPALGELLPGAESVKKAHFDCFSCDAFSRRVEALRRRTIILTGVEAHICVAQTALAAPAGYTVHVVADAIASRTPGNRQIAIDRMARAGSIITSTEMFIYEVLRKAGTDEFKAVLPLVK